MKLAAYVCSGCGAAYDPDDPAWVTAGGTDIHSCLPNGATKGIGRLKRSAARQEQIDDERQAIAEVAPKIATEVRRATLTRELEKKKKPA